MIKIIQDDAADPLIFQVTITDNDGETHHRVTMSNDTYKENFNISYTPVQCVEAAFCFLLEREPKEAILSRFDITVISGYFPEFKHEISTYMKSLK